MKILVPIDGSECSFTALQFATEFATHYDATIQVVHFVESQAKKQDDETQQLLDRATDILDAAGVKNQPAVETDVWITPYTYAGRIGKDILQLVAEDNFDHVIMGHHGTGVVARALLGSTAEAVIKRSDVPVTVVPQ